MSDIILRVAVEFSRTPGSRYVSEGDHSGELFRIDHLLPKVQEAIKLHRKIIVNLDGTAGYGTSFLEEAFGGLVRNDGILSDTIHKVLQLISVEEPYLIDDIWEYIDEAKR